jgi:hypothetical protein
VIAGERTVEGYQVAEHSLRRSPNTQTRVDR